MLTKVRNLRFVAIAEGISFLLLLLIAMPLKYYMERPEAVTIIGWAHGVLFMAYVALVFYARKAMQWNLLGLGIALIASLLPFGTFVLDIQMKKRQRQLESLTTKNE